MHASSVQTLSAKVRQLCSMNAGSPNDDLAQPPMIVPPLDVNAIAKGLRLDLLYLMQASCAVRPAPVGASRLRVISLLANMKFVV